MSSRGDFCACSRAPQLNYPWEKWGTAVCSLGWRLYSWLPIMWTFKGNLKKVWVTGSSYRENVKLFGIKQWMIYVQSCFITVLSCSDKGLYFSMLHTTKNMTLNLAMRHFLNTCCEQLNLIQNKFSVHYTSSSNKVQVIVYRLWVSGRSELSRVRVIGRCQL